MAGDDRSQPDAAEADALRRRLAEAIAERDAGAREAAELKALNRDLEYRVLTANRTLAYGLGKALIEARSIAGLVALPRRLRRLRLKQQAKRRPRVPESAARDAASNLRYVDEALDRLARDGADAAAAWIGKLPKANRAAKARAMTELAIAVAGERIDIADTLGNEAAAIYAAEPRLLALALLLRERGMVIGPAAIGESIRRAQHLSAAQDAMIARMTIDATILRDGHPDRDLRDLAAAADRSDGIVIAHAASSRLDHRVARVAAICSAEGRPIREIELADLPRGLDGPPPALVHVMAGGAEETRQAVAVARRTGLPVLLDIGALDPALFDSGDGETGQVARMRLGWLGATAHGVIARGPKIAEHLTEIIEGRPRVADDCFMIGPLESDAAHVAATEFGIPLDGPVLLCVTSLDEDRGAAEMLEAFAETTRDEEHCRLVFMGRGPATAALAERAAVLGLGARTHFIGLPLAVRWPALFEMATLTTFPRKRSEAPGSGLETAHGVARAAGVRVSGGAAMVGEQASDDAIGDLHRALAALGRQTA